jgi:uncharacterized repeat protein (TIGR01451 family)
LLVVMLTLAGASFLGATSAQTAGNKYLVTYVARSCPSYTAVTANRARNNIQESLRDLGADTPYAAGQEIDPTIEASNQPLCTPIPNWQFQLGTGIVTQGSHGPWGALSIVNGIYPGAITTLPTTPLLNVTGQPTGNSIAGAVTVALTDSQADRAASPNNLWVAGGVSTDPVLNQVFPDQYGFAALRCGIDSLNGDNVEWVAFPTGATHSFCFAYYVKPPPTSGTIIVRKQVTGADAYRQTFNFQGNVSYNPGGSFQLTAGPGAPGQTSFFRAEVPIGGAPWSFSELPIPNWALDSLSCTSATNDSQTTITGASASVVLAAGDTVTCTYTDRFVPPLAGLQISKTTLGRIGTFDFDVTKGGGSAGKATATTTQEGTPVSATPALSLGAGSYRINESSPASRRGRWVVDSVFCNGDKLPDSDNVIVNLVSGMGTACAYTNRFIPSGRIRLRKTTLGAVGTTGFVVSPVAGDDKEFLKSATTTQQGVPATASGDSTRALSLGKYVIQETTPSDPREGSWALQSVECNGEAIPADQGKIEVTLTAAEPSLTCDFVNKFSATPIVGPGGETVDPITSLKVTKSAAPTTIAVGGKVIYTVRVSNSSDVPAENVTVTEQLGSGGQITSIKPSSVKCSLRPIPVCQLGAIKAHSSKTFRVAVRVSRAGVITNRVAVNTSTEDGNVKNNVANARVRVTSDPGFTG